MPKISNVSLTPAEWRLVAADFRPAAKDAAAERRQIAHAVATMQKLVGRQTGTAAHQWTHKDKAILPNNGDPTQLDCIDEAVNTWTYMTLMEKERLLRFHRVAHLAYAGSAVTLDQRNTAVIEDTKSGEYFAVDATLVDSGVPPPMIPLTTWIAQWPPDLPAADANASTAKPRPKPKHPSSQVSKL